MGEGLYFDYKKAIALIHQKDLPNQNHEFLDGSYPYTINPGGPNHEELVSLIGIYEYFDNLYQHHFGNNEDDILKKIEEARLSVVRRSESFSEDLKPNTSVDWNNIDVLLGDSFGEMYFYLKLCDHVVAGGGFWHTGAHNIIEQLQLHKPVTVGPEIWTIKFPALQAEEIGLLKVVKDPAELTNNPSFF